MDTKTEYAANEIFEYVYKKMKSGRYTKQELRDFIRWKIEAAILSGFRKEAKHYLLCLKDARKESEEQMEKNKMEEKRIATIQLELQEAYKTLVTAHYEHIKELEESRGPNEI